MAENVAAQETLRDERNGSRDERNGGGLSGHAGVTSAAARSPLWMGLLVIGGFTLLVNTVNVFTAVHDAAEHGERLPIWEPAVWESTSGIATLLFCPIAYFAIRYATPGRAPWPKLIVVHVGASFAFSALHVLLMNVLRVAIYAAVGDHYPFGESGFWYEYRKDLIAYILFAAIFWFFARPARHAAAKDTDPRMFDIRDGRRLLRVTIEEIVAVHAAGNYVEFLLADGRSPLCRNSLGNVQRQLGPDFVRTHRSWAVNVRQVRSLTSLGAGDFAVELNGGKTVPVSRRFPEALAQLRSPSKQAQAS